MIQVAGRKVQLPPDAYIEHRLDLVDCVVGTRCPEAPYLVLRRGNSTVAVTERTGVRFSEHIAPGEEGAFDFLSEAARLVPAANGAEATRPPGGQPCTMPPKPGLLDVAAVVERLRARGLQAERIDAHLVSDVGGACAEVVRVNGLTIQVYRFAIPAEARRAFERYSGGTRISWIARPHFVWLENLFIAVVTDDEPLAARIVGALQQTP